MSFINFVLTVYMHENYFEGKGIFYYNYTFKIFLCFKAPWIMSKRPPSQWPNKGIVEFINYQARYRDDLSLALQDITFQTHGEEKVTYIFHKFHFPFYLNIFIKAKVHCGIECDGHLFKFHMKVIKTYGWYVQYKFFLYR